MSRFRDLFMESTSTSSTLEGYKEDAIDGDGDGLVQDNTPHERPAPVKATRKKKGFTMD